MKLSYLFITLLLLFLPQAAWPQTTAEGTSSEKKYNSNRIFEEIHLYREYKASHNAEKAKEYENILLADFEKYTNKGPGPDSIDWLAFESLSDEVATIFANNGMAEDAISLRESMREAEKIAFGPQSMERYLNLYWLSFLYLKTHNYKEADKVIEETLGTLDFASDTSEYSYSRKLQMYLMKCFVLQAYGKTGEAIDLCERLRAEEPENAKDLEKITLADTYAYMLKDIGDSKRASELRREILLTIPKIYGENSPEHAQALLSLAQVDDNREEGLEVSKKAVSIYKSLYGERSENYYYASQCLASYYPRIDKNLYWKMEEELANMAKDIFGEESLEYARALAYSVDFAPDKVDSGIERLETALRIERKMGLENSSIFNIQLPWLSTLYAAKEDWEKLFRNDSLLLQLKKEYVVRNFAGLREEQREQMWNDICFGIDNIAPFASLFCSKSKPADFESEAAALELAKRFCAQAYDSRLFYKGLLLSSTTALNRILSSAGNDRVRQLQSEVKTLEGSLSQCANEAERKEANNNIEERQRELLHIASELSNGSFVDFTECNWEAISEALQPGEVAIEFFSYAASGDTQYAASWISAGKSPWITALFDEKDLTLSDGTCDYNTPDVYNHIWRILERYPQIRKAKTIYFSADGLLNTLAIENAPDSAHVLAKEKWKMVRLSSTRELLNKGKKSSRIGNAALFGGLNYDMGQEELVAASQKFGTSRTADRAINRGTARYGVDYLPFTLKEVGNIDSLLKKNGNTQCELLTGNAGTEEALRTLSGKQTDVLHLATHGFFWDDETAENRNYIPFLRDDPTQQLNNKTQQAMTHAGLLLSGANCTLKGTDLPAYVDDGVLTAREIAELDLSNVGLAVLSACETGQGIANGEGVFGLQRGFKLAGTHSLLMSLWKVDDEATTLLMTEFYKRLLAGDAMTDALKYAQQSLRQSEKFSSPDHWAGWILLDAME